ncbi:hypothetical protein DRQ05_03560 [bacterium]|nr:MAG: hypothetical protein DRQ05_03560 [bacterium]
MARERKETFILGKELIRFNGVSLGYAGKVVLENLNFSIDENDFLGIIGPNGCGKTTILRSITGRISPSAGSIEISRKLRLGYVIQRQFLDEIFPFSVREVVEMGRYDRLGLFGRLSSEDRKVVEESLDMVELRHMMNVPFRSLSGGQKQRVLIARALAFQPELMLLDEPTNDLDIAGENKIMDLIHEIHHKKGLTVVIVSHLLHVILNHVEKLLFIQDHRAVMRSIDRITEDGFISELYGSRVKIGTVGGKKVVIAE